MVMCVSECASSVPPGWCTPWGSVCSERPGVWRPHRVGRASAAWEHRESAGAGPSDGGTVQRDWCSCCCSAGSGRGAG